MDYSGIQGKQTVRTISETLGITRQSAINLICKLHKQGLVEKSGGGKQIRIFTVHKMPIRPTNGFYDLVNRYSEEKLVPKFRHYVHGKYTVEQAIIDGIQIGDRRTLDATKYLFNHVKNWKMLFDLADQKQLTNKVHELYSETMKTMRCRRMPARYAR